MRLDPDFAKMTRREQWENLLRRCREGRQEVAQLFDDVRDWNAANPTEAPLVADPDGELLRALIYYDQQLAALLRKEPPPDGNA